MNHDTPSIPGMYCPLIREDCKKFCRFMVWEIDTETGARLPRRCLLEQTMNAIIKAAPGATNTESGKAVINTATNQY